MRSSASSARGSPIEIAMTAESAVDAVVPLAAKNSGLLDTTPNRGWAMAIAVSPSRAAPR